MKTAMQQLLSILREDYQHPGWIDFEELEEIIENEMMPIEKQQIVEAYRCGWRMDNYYLVAPLQYYNETYNNSNTPTT